MNVVQNKGVISIGIDIGVVVEAAWENFANGTEYLIVQGDIYNPPFRPRTFDG